MAFGGFFGGGSSSSDSDKSSSSSSSIPTDAPTAQAVFPPSAMPSMSSSSSSDIKNRLTTAISNQANVINAKMLIERVNENCFDHCVTAPGNSLSSKENQCLSACMEKYIDGWNTVSKTYVSRLQKESAKAGIGGGLGGL